MRSTLVKNKETIMDNRIKEIKQQQNMTFRYIASSHNPSDYATRGLTVSTINKSSLWWHGPSWLETNRLLWPVWNSSEITPENLEHLEAEFNRSKSFTEGVHVAVDKLNEKEVLLFGIQKPLCSSLRRLLRISVYVLRLLKKKVWNKLDEEIKLVSLLWIYTIQCHHYRDVFIALKNNKRNCLQKQLGLQEDEFGILRCHGRYANADISEETKFPKLLPRRNYF